MTLIAFNKNMDKCYGNMERQVDELWGIGKDQKNISFGPEIKKKKNCTMTLFYGAFVVSQGQCYPSGERGRTFQEVGETVDQSRIMCPEGLDVLCGDEEGDLWPEKVWLDGLDLIRRQALLTTNPSLNNLKVQLQGIACEIFFLSQILLIFFFKLHDSQKTVLS